MLQAPRAAPNLGPSHELAACKTLESSVPGAAGYTIQAISAERDNSRVCVYVNDNARNRPARDDTSN